MYFIVTIDTEEDQWSEYKTIGNTVENIDSIPKLQNIFDSYNIRPTYLLTYPVVEIEKSAKIIHDLINSGNVEIGAHCHPWNTPPFEEDLNIKNSMLCNLDRSLQFKKLQSLTEFIHQKFNIEPKSFRAGRWGFNLEIAEHLVELGYDIDTSYTPFVSWERYSGPNFENVFTFRHRINTENLKSKKRAISEIPVTIGYNRPNFSAWHQYEKFFSKNKLLKRIMISIPHRIGLLRKVWVSPETNPFNDIKQLIDCCYKMNYHYINMMFHSNSLKEGLTPFVASKEEQGRFYNLIQNIVQYTTERGCLPVTLSEYNELCREG